MSDTERRVSDGSGATAEDRRPDSEEQIVELVRERYGELARRGASCCAAGTSPLAGAASRWLARLAGYGEDELSCAPQGAQLGLGCGAPIELLELQPGETVLDVGCGAGLDAILAARKVGPEGRVIGVDMTPEMLERARENAREAGLGQIEIVEGRLERLPLDDASVDAVTSNCVINLVPDKAQVFREIARVLRPGGRLVISDIVLEKPLPEPIGRSVLALVGCVSGAERREAYFEQVRDAGLAEVDVLKRVDLASAAGSRLPAEIDGLLRRAGLRIDELHGTVFSVTFRAVKP